MDYVVFGFLIALAFFVYVAIKDHADPNEPDDGATV